MGTIHRVECSVGRQLAVNMDWTLFRGLKVIALELSSILDGISFLKAVNGTLSERVKSAHFWNLEVLHLLKMRVESNENEDDSSFIVDVLSPQKIHHLKALGSYFNPYYALIAALSK